MTLVLSHDPRTRITSGFFGHTLDEGDEIISTLKKSAHLALHPLLIPALIHSAWFKIMFDQYAHIHGEMRSVQERTGVMKKYLNEGRKNHRKQGRSKMRKFDKLTGTQSDHDDIHETIVEQHAYLSTALSDFVSKLGPAIMEGLEDVRKLNPASYNDLGLEKYVKHWKMRIDRELEHREQLLKRIDVQIQVVRKSCLTLRIR
jgi:Dihaem cytochrome c